MHKLTIAVALLCYNTVSFSQSIAAENNRSSDLLSNAQPIDCRTYKANFEINVRKFEGLIPVPIYKEQSYPGDLLLSNYNFVQAVISCNQSGKFEGVGATLLNDSSPKTKQWIAMLLALIQSIDESISIEDASSVLIEISSKTSGNPGSVSIEKGAYSISYKLGNGPNRFGIDLR